MPCRVSIVTPSYNQGRFIERTIQSIIRQEVPGGLEYFVADGGSRDETVDILKRYESKLSWISEPDRGQADAVNKGVARTRGEIIGWVNSDDVYYPGAVRAACDYFDTHPEVDVLYGDANHIDESDNIIEPYPTQPWSLERLNEECFLCQPAVFFRRSVVERFGALDIRCNYALDYEYWLRLGRSGARFGWLQKVLAGSRLHDQTKTLGLRVNCHSEINDVLKQHLKRVPEIWLYNYAHAVVETRGYERSRPVRFALALSAVTLYASMRWNRRVSRAVTRRALEWIGGAFRAGGRPQEVA